MGRSGPVGGARLATALAISAVIAVGAGVQANEEIGPAAAVQESEAAVREDAISYASEFHVPIDEAVRRLTLQASAHDLRDDMQELKPGRFAGVWLEHAPVFKVVVAYTGSRDGLGPVVDRANSSALVVEIRTGATHSLQQLLEGLGRLAPDLDATLADVASDVDVRAGALRLVSPRDIPAATVAEMQATAGVPIVVERGGPEIPLHNYGGSKLTVAGEEHCTTGFTVLHESGDEGIITAGHCNTNLVYWQNSSISYSLTFKGQFNDASHDGQWHTSGHDTFDDFWDGNSYRDVNGQVARHNALGDFVCHYGIGSNPFGTPQGKSCGTVQSITHDPGNICGDAATGNCNNTWIRLTGANLACWEGDSGGPLFTAGLAYGILFSGDPSGPLPGQCASATFMSRDYFGDMNLVVLQ